MSKLLYLIRHGFSLHNELFHKIGTKAFQLPEVIDSPLTEQGIQQSKKLCFDWKNKTEIELVLVSPLSRALETSEQIFSDMDVPIVCLEFLREYPIGEDTCNKRSDTEYLKNKFPRINFDEIKLEGDTLWTEERETIEQLEERLEEMRNYIRTRSENKIAIVSHSSYLGQFKDNKIGYIENGDKDLQYCYPYEYILN